MPSTFTLVHVEWFVKCLILTTTSSNHLAVAARDVKSDGSSEMGRFQLKNG